jgi:hypothetical protein
MYDGASALANDAWKWIAAMYEILLAALGRANRKLMQSPIRPIEAFFVYGPPLPILRRKLKQSGRTVWYRYSPL